MLDDPSHFAARACMPRVILLTKRVEEKCTGLPRATLLWLRDSRLSGNVSFEPPFEELEDFS